MEHETSNISRRQLEGGCPAGSKWYACSGIPFGFVGCCTVNPCTNIGCAAGNLRAATLGDLAYGSTRDQVCQAGGVFYTCTSPSFWGCCKGVPCGTGCSAELLAPASLDMLSGNPFSPDDTTATSSNNTETASRGGTPIGAIVGGVIGGFVVALLLAGLVWFLRRRKRKEPKEVPSLPMAYNSHSHHADPASNMPLTSPHLPEAVEAGYYASPVPKRPFPPSAYQRSPTLPGYSPDPNADRRVSYELGDTPTPGFVSPPLSSPGFGESYHKQSSRPMSYELAGSPPPPPVGHAGTPSLLSVSELSSDTRYSQPSTLRFSGQSTEPLQNHPGNHGLGVSTPQEYQQYDDRRTRPNNEQ